MNPVIGIIGGKGQMGNLFAGFFKERNIKVLVSDLKTNLSNKELAQKADIVIISVPIDKTEKTILEVLPYIKKDAAIMDFTSVKQMSVKTMVKGKCEVLGIHPMFGNTNPIPGQTIILNPTKKSGKYTKWIEGFFKKHNVNVIKMSAKEHDKIMGIAQGLVHFADIAFLDGLKSSKISLDKIIKYCSKASELKILLAARLIAQDPGLYGNIQIENPYTIKFLKKYKKSFEKLIKIIEKKDLASYKKFHLRNRRFTGNYAKKALKESSYLIDKLIEKRSSKNLKQTQQKPGKNDIAVLGPKNSFSDLAATKYSPKNSKKFYTKNIEEVFELVEKGKVKEGIVPIENSYHGTIRETLDGLFLKNVHISKEFLLPINQCLISLEGAAKKDIKTIISHTQALNQCKKYLDKNFPKIEIQSSVSTSAAVQKIVDLNKKTIAAIGPEIAAEKKELKVLAKNIEDQKDNSTKFIIIKKGKTNLTSSAEKTSIAFHFSKDAPGSLFQIFKIFADSKINLTKIESRPTKTEFGDYVFYLDFEGNIKEKNTKTILKKIQNKVAKLKILGSY